eukprot:TRINITY_DN2582_c0_g1_i2.p2 TRINITY_DN2582_c0_g1~~TRINITY_DN2582_c0_g1_i2.p2  ORF type:complete len:169 (+),score=24.16 TRINITY_DN2582_c0_g1_i2:204-710(+)
MGDALPTVSLGTHSMAIAAGFGHTCALTMGRTVRCWGLNADGQLGYGDTRNRGGNASDMGNALPDVGLGGVVVALSTGAHHTCAVVSGIGVKCWGRGAAGRLGQGGTANVGDDSNEVQNVEAVWWWSRGQVSSRFAKSLRLHVASGGYGVWVSPRAPAAVPVVVQQCP